MAAEYRIQILPSAARELEGLPANVLPRVVEAIDRLGREPRPDGCVMLSGLSREQIYRIRVGDYRILYQLLDVRLIVLVVRVANRRDVYDRTVLKRLRRQLRGSST